MDKFTDREVEFLKELTELSKKHKVYIAGCGCCESPYLYEDGARFGCGYQLSGRDHGKAEVEWG